MTTEHPPSTDDALGRILRELGSLRSDFHEFRTTGDSRHRLLVNEIAEVRAESKRAVEIAVDAKRLADGAAHEMRDTQRAVVEHTRGLATRQAALEAAVDGIRTVNERQTASLDVLVAAETERKIRERALSEQDEKRWRWVGRVWPIATALVALGAYLIGHWKP